MPVMFTLSQEKPSQPSHLSRANVRPRCEGFCEGFSEDEKPSQWLLLDQIKNREGFGDDFDKNNKPSRDFEANCEGCEGCEGFKRNT